MRANHTPPAGRQAQQKNFGAMKLKKLVLAVFTLALTILVGIAPSPSFGEDHAVDPQAIIRAINAATSLQPGLIKEIDVHAKEIEVYIVAGKGKHYLMAVSMTGSQVAKTRVRNVKRTTELLGARQIIHAVNAAAKAHPGLIKDVDVERENGKLFVEVEMLQAGKEVKVLVTPNGQVVSP